MSVFLTPEALSLSHARTLSRSLSVHLAIRKQKLKPLNGLKPRDVDEEVAIRTIMIINCLPCLLMSFYSYVFSPGIELLAGLRFDHIEGKL
jgi:hypothetical protein